MTTVLLEVTGLSCRRGGRPVFEGLSFDLAGGGLLALTGRNGSGKTTLLRALALLVTAEAGQIRWQGEDVARDREAWRRQIAWLGHLDGLKGDLSVGRTLPLPPAARTSRQTGSTRPLTSFDLAALARREVRTLSAGQRRRVALARVASAHAPLWLLDEPLNALDAPSQAALRTVLGRTSPRRPAIAATHAPIDVAGARALDLGR
jgi:heme exporter protein A